MQRSWVTPKDRAGALLAVGLVHAGLLAALLTLGQTSIVPGSASDPIDLIDVQLPEPPPPPEPVAVETSKAPEEEGAAAPPARKAEATPVVRPKPKVVLPPRPTVTAAEKPGTGAAEKQGAAPVDGPGTGAGGQGSGTGSGSGGSGSGGGGGGGAAERPALVGRSLTQRDYSSSARRNWPSGKRVLVSFDVLLSGRASDCRVVQSSGVAGIDAETCRLVTTKLRFRVAKDRDGKPVVERYGYVQYPLF
jgi:protein TonB